MYEEELAKAAQVAGSVTFQNRKDQEDQIRPLAFKVAGKFGKIFELKVSGQDVTVTFS